MVGGYRLGLWVDEEPGPGLFPFVCAALLLAFVSVRLVQDWVRSPATTVTQRRRLALYVAALITAATLFDGLGFPLTALIALLAILIAGEELPLRRALAISITLVLATIALFDVALNVPLPWGPLAGLRFWAS